jgi:hypothetical protein
MLKKFLSYLTFWKKDESSHSANFNLKVMHGINKISILIFLIAVIIIFIKYVFA